MNWKFKLILVASVALGAECQLVQVGPVDPNSCNKIRVEPNLVIEQTAEITGRLIDASGEPFRNSPIKVRAYVSPQTQADLTVVTTDKNGHFSIRSLAQGKYRLLASPTRAFAQPAGLHCTAPRCELSIELHPNPTDLPDSQCPIR